MCIPRPGLVASWVFLGIGREKYRGKEVYLYCGVLIRRHEAIETAHEGVVVEVLPVLLRIAVRKNDSKIVVMHEITITTNTNSTSSSTLHPTTTSMKLSPLA